jgi:hypothetical protein
MQSSAAKVMMMTTPTFEFLLKSAPDRATARAWVDLCISTGRFHRNEKSQLTFKVGPGDHVLIVHKLGLRSILEDADVINVTGDLGETCTDCLWLWLNDLKWKLPRLNPNAAFNPPAPRPVAHVRPEERYSHGRDCAPVRKLPVNT